MHNSTFRTASTLFVMFFLLAGNLIPVQKAIVDGIKASDVGQDIMIGVRPPDLDCNLSPVDGAFPAEIYAVEHSGRNPLVNVKLGDQIIEVISDCLTSDVPIGTPLWLSLDNSRLYVFDAATSKLVVTSHV